MYSQNYDITGCCYLWIANCATEVESFLHDLKFAHLEFLTLENKFLKLQIRLNLLSHGLAFLQSSIFIWISVLRFARFQKIIVLWYTVDINHQNTIVDYHLIEYLCNIHQTRNYFQIDFCQYTGYELRIRIKLQRKNRMKHYKVRKKRSGVISPLLWWEGRFLGIMVSDIRDNYIENSHFPTL